MSTSMQDIVTTNLDEILIYLINKFCQGENMPLLITHFVLLIMRYMTSSLYSIFSSLSFLS